MPEPNTLSYIHDKKDPEIYRILYNGKQIGFGNNDKSELVKRLCEILISHDGAINFDGTLLKKDRRYDFLKITRYIVYLNNIKSLRTKN